MVRKTRQSEVETASSDEALSFIQALQREFAGKRKSKAERERLRQYLAKFEAEKLRSIARRVMIDLVKPPVRTIAKDETATETSPPLATVTRWPPVKRLARTNTYTGSDLLPPPPRYGGRATAETRSRGPRAIPRVGVKRAKFKARRSHGKSAKKS
jgi:hypothetical protein